MMPDPTASPSDTPLAGRRIVVTRPREQSRELCGRLQGLGAQVISFPTVKIVPPGDTAPLKAALQQIKQYDWILLTSRNAVDAVVDSLPDDPAALSEVQIAAVGEVTRRRLSDLGLEAKFVPSNFNMAALCAELIQTENVDQRRFLYPCGDLADPDGPQPLRDAGAVVDAVVAYRTVPDETADADALQQRLGNREIDAVIFASPSAVEAFFARIEATYLSAHIALVSIGPKTAQALSERTERCVIQAERADSEGIADAVVRALG